MSGTDAMPGPFPAWVAGAPAIWAPDVIQGVSSTPNFPDTETRTLISIKMTVRL
jgi:hypothetical protein